ncbi:nuclear transport factor 2 family protein [Cocleimonas sp. KMM 6892]|uniref:nuclear transport factor 2 family protein n=1 Tax=unclassified Cocleimonas TaxID=2639732 RepID=UPI002DBC560F|nr:MULTISPECIES: nuclear transport factor 2 family protein [unclassified Cocleimonas]MEB8432035.1 nuclear transport factor 2 family protein [Cocleimonas sp. KMM 6892]MEC4714879.1 nuclear transport factor 2 family protein [Cocleimonas sp. KMM 6895]MEC4744307.1 nuclear transport factor 2 family protein [Cocleimonas sp. KMM 6896]
MYHSTMKKDNSEYYFATADEAEAAFYSAFEMGDKDLMEALIADDNVSCIHPSSVPLVGREDVIESWNQILHAISGSVIKVEVMNRTNSNGVAVHLVTEIFADSDDIETEFSEVLATNVYVEQENGWRLMMHHASYISESEYTDEDLLEDSEDLMDYEISQTVH